MQLTRLQLYKLFILIGIHSMQSWTAITGKGVTRKRSTKRSKCTGNLLRKNKMASTDKWCQLIQRKAFYTQKIIESSCAREETVETGILVTSRNG